MDDGTKRFNKKLIYGTDDKIFFIPTHQTWIVVKLLVHRDTNSTSKGFLASLWNILMTRAKKQ